MVLWEPAVDLPRVWGHIVVVERVAQAGGVPHRGRKGKGHGVLLVSGKLVDNWYNVVYLYVYLITD